MRSSASSAVTRRINSLAPLLPGTTAFLTASDRVSNETPPLYLPLVWHSAQRALRIGSTSWAESTGSAARAGAAQAAKSARTATGVRTNMGAPAGAVWGGALTVVYVIQHGQRA